MHHPQHPAVHMAAPGPLVETQTPSFADYNLLPAAEIRRRAITSYGIIPCLVDDRDAGGGQDDLRPVPRRTFLFLIAQRRDTIAYSEFIKARVGPGELERYAGLMTRAERARIAAHSFPQLWHDFWIHADNRLYHSEYARCAAAFGPNQAIVARAASAGLVESPWGFPKGRKCPGETDQDCALREFEEETRIDRRSLHPLAGAPSVHEYYLGSDQRWYRTVYFLCRLTYRPTVPMLATPHHIRRDTITEEIGCLRWVDVAGAFACMDLSRRRVVRAAHQFLLGAGGVPSPNPVSRADGRDYNWGVAVAGAPTGRWFSTEGGRPFDIG
jgi:8-oxo-dGTP pyrophosphatase MutT (NUDIX family)